MALNQTSFLTYTISNQGMLGRNVEVFLDVRIEGKHTPVTVKLSYQQSFIPSYSSGAVPFRAMMFSMTCSGKLSPAGNSLKMVYFSRQRPTPPVQSASHHPHLPSSC